jgi:hypothetical protein
MDPVDVTSVWTSGSSRPKRRQRITEGCFSNGFFGVPVRPKLLKRFYEALAILYILGQSRGEPTEEDELELAAEPEEMDSHKLRRSFTRHLAYLCDYEKGGDRTSAIGLRQTPQGIVYLFASNKTPNTTGGIKDRTKDFLVEILTSLKNLSPNDASAIESKLFLRSVDFSSARIHEYSKRLKDPLQYILSHVIEAKISSGKIECLVNFISWVTFDETKTLISSIGLLQFNIHLPDRTNSAVCAMRYGTQTASAVSHSVLGMVHRVLNASRRFAT